MFAYLIGTVAEVTPEKLVLEVNRIGYNIRIPASAVSLLPPVGEEVKIYTYTSVREDAVTLFGFLRKDDLEMYRQLINVSENRISSFPRCPQTRFGSRYCLRMKRPSPRRQASVERWPRKSFWN